MEQALYLLSGAALTWAFYFVQRRIERRDTVDTIERNQKLLTLKQGLEGAGTSLDELRRFERRLIGKAEAAVRIADRYVSQAEQVARESDEPVLDEAAMNLRAIASFQQVDDHLDRLVTRLRAALDGTSLAAFDAVHLGWLGYRERYARFIAEAYSGGAIQPLIHAVTLESITAAWITELETQLGDGDDDEEEA
ncbi:MAG TPA: lysozyme inhibitor LprI family protein [Lysobacter sp.]|nr:lysozyme inhibitor LprI family protein [Lysobacter sp.]